MTDSTRLSAVTMSLNAIMAFVSAGVGWFIRTQVVAPVPAPSVDAPAPGA